MDCHNFETICESSFSKRETICSANWSILLSQTLLFCLSIVGLSSSWCYSVPFLFYCLLQCNYVIFGLYKVVLFLSFLSLLDEINSNMKVLTFSRKKKMRQAWPLYSSCDQLQLFAALGLYKPYPPPMNSLIFLWLARAHNVVYTVGKPLGTCLIGAKPKQDLVYRLCLPGVLVFFCLALLCTSP